MEDLEDLITYYHEALALCPPGHVHRSSSLNNLGNAVSARYQQLGRIEDLEKHSPSVIHIGNRSTDYVSQ